MNYKYPEIRDVLMILAKYVQNGTLLGNQKYAGKAVLTLRDSKNADMLANFLMQNSVNPIIAEESGGKVVLFDLGKSEVLDTTVNEMHKDEKHMLNVANRILHSRFKLPAGRDPR